jgi:hypothetical protein
MTARGWPVPFYVSAGEENTRTVTSKQLEAALRVGKRYSTNLQA